MVVLCLTLSWLGKREESKGPGPGTTPSSAVHARFGRTGEQPQGWKKGNRHVYSSETLSRNISTEVQKTKGLAGPTHFPACGKKIKLTVVMY